MEKHTMRRLCFYRTRVSAISSIFPSMLCGNNHPTGQLTLLADSPVLSVALTLPQSCE